MMKDGDKTLLLAPYSGLSSSSGVMTSVLNQTVHDYGRDSVPFGSLLRLVFSQSLVVRRYLQVPTDSLPEEIQVPISAAALSVDVEGLRSRLGHTTVNEFHLLHSLFESHPSLAHSALRPIVDEYRRTHLLGSPGQKVMRELILARATQTMGQLGDLFAKTPFDVETVIESLKAYLESDFYPYGAESWVRFRDECLRKWRSDDDISRVSPLHAFIANEMAVPF